MSERGFQLPSGYLRSWIDELTDENTVGFLLSGSHARGDASRFSDVDLTKFVNELPTKKSERYVVRFKGDNLLCVTVTTVASKLDELQRPETAIWAVPGIRQARVVSDPTGAIESLKSSAAVFDWSGLRMSADHYAANELAGLSEEAHKLLNAAETDDASARDYAIIGLLLGLTKVAAVKLGVMIPSENSYFRVVREAVGGNSRWSEHHVAIGDAPTRADRASAALSLYVETAHLLGSVENVDDDAVIRGTVERIESFDEP